MGTREDEYDYLFKGKYTHPNQLINKQYTSLDICLVIFVHSIIYLVFIPHRRRVLFFLIIFSFSPCLFIQFLMQKTFQCY